MTPQENPSFYKVNYSIRANKNIERKLIFDALIRLPHSFKLEQYRYIGFGSMWFIDFIFAHRLLRITSMWSIERVNSSARAEFNRPYDCIEIKSGDSCEILARMAPEEWSIPFIAWFDYDGRFDKDVFGDCEILLTKASPGSVILMTVNAHRNSYKPVDESGYARASINTLREIFGDSVPVEGVPSEPREIEISKFPNILSGCILNLMGHIVRGSGRASKSCPYRFIPLFAFEHNDGAPMITVGGMLADWRRISDLEVAMGVEADALFSGKAKKTETLDLVPITTKEKLSLDRLLPCSESEFDIRFGGSGIKLDINQARKYRRFYSHFPVFAETIL